MTNAETATARACQWQIKFPCRPHTFPPASANPGKNDSMMPYVPRSFPFVPFTKNLVGGLG
jgi:hypothetical protein